MPALGQPLHRLHRRFAPRGPQVQPRDRVVPVATRNPASSRPSISTFATLGVALSLDHRGAVVGQRGRSGGLDRGRAPSARDAAQGDQPDPMSRVTGDETGAVPGQVRTLGQRVHRQQAGVVAVRSRPDAGSTPAGLPSPGRGSTRRTRPPRRAPGPLHHLGQMRDAEHPSGRIRRRVQPDQRRGLRPHRSQRVGSQHRVRRPSAHPTS